MNSGLQRFSLEARLKAEGVEPDTVDLTALLDPTLSYTENLRSVGEGTWRVHCSGVEFVSEVRNDRDSILAFLVQDERTLRGRAETALWTNSPDYVKAHVEIFEQAWSSGIPAETRIEALRQASGGTD